MLSSSEHRQQRCTAGRCIRTPGRSWQRRQSQIRDCAASARLSPEIRRARSPRRQAAVSGLAAPTPWRAVPKKRPPCANWSADTWLRAISRSKSPRTRFRRRSISRVGTELCYDRHDYAPPRRAAHSQAMALFMMSVSISLARPCGPSELTQIAARSLVALGTACRTPTECAVQGSCQTPRGASPGTGRRALILESGRR